MPDISDVLDVLLDVSDILSVSDILFDFFILAQITFANAIQYLIFELMKQNQDF